VCTISEHTSIDTLVLIYVDSSTYTAFNTPNVFTINCDVEYPSLKPGSEDVVAMWSYSLGQLLEVCSALNGRDYLSSRYIGAIIGSSMKSNAGYNGNCWLKADLGTAVTSTAGQTFGRLVMG
jgi:hypothetical protein